MTEPVAATGAGRGREARAAGRRGHLQAPLRGINAAVVGLLPATRDDPVWSRAIKGPAEFAMALVGCGLLMLWRRAPWLVVGVTAASAAVIAAVA